MKIFINALSARLGGGQTYLRHLLEKFPEGKNTIYITCPDNLALPQNRNNFTRVLVPEKIISNPFVRTFWEAFILPNLLNDLKIDVLFCPGGSVTGFIPTECKIVTTFQNMMPFDHVQRKKYPKGYMRLRNWLLERRLLKSMERSHLVIFISEFAKKIIQERSAGKIKKSVVIPHGVNPDFRKGASLPRPTWLPNESEGYLLYVSILDVYKSQIEVIEAYASLLSRKNNIPKLFLIGPEYPPYGKKVREKITTLAEKVILKSAIPNHELPAVYQHATLNIFASQTENCPFILLEALASGTPVLVSECQPMPEFGGEAVLYFNPNDPLDLAAKIERVLEDKNLQIELGNKALRQSFCYNWDEAAQKTWQSIENLV